MPRANWHFIGNCPVPFPPLSEQEQIVRYLDWKVSQINKFVKLICGSTSIAPNVLENYPKSLLALLIEYRTHLISDVVTGKMDVRGIAVPEYEAVENVSEYNEEEEETDDE